MDKVFVQLGFCTLKLVPEYRRILENQWVPDSCQRHVNTSENEMSIKSLCFGFLIQWEFCHGC